MGAEDGTAIDILPCSYGQVGFLTAIPEPKTYVNLMIYGTTMRTTLDMLPNPAVASCLNLKNESFLHA